MNRHDSDEGGWVRRCSLSSSAVGFTIDEDVFLDTERSHTTQAVGFVAFSQDFDTRISDGVSSWGMEAAKVVLPATTTNPTFKSISFRRSYATPPVVVVLATNETSEPAAIRIRNVTTTGFQAVQVEPATNDGVQGAMTLHYLAVEPGTHELPDGTRILAGTRNTNRQQHGSGVTGSEGWQSVTFATWPGTAGSGNLPNTQVFNYNANGNRSSMTENGLLYSYTNLLNSNRLLSTAGPAPKTYSYDPAGNVLSDGTHSYGYDDRGRLTAVDAGAVSYQHNGQGQRVKKQAGATSTLFVYDEAGQLLGEYNGTGAAIQETVWFQGAPVAILQGANQYYVHTDHLGTPRVITNGNTAIWRWESDPFGATSADQDPDGDLTPFTYNLRFPGQYYDSETGQHYNYFRTYDPSTGRYLESDPLGTVAGTNTYSYVLNSPTNGIDPLGLWSPDAHDAIIQHALGDRLPQSDIDIIKAASRDFDKRTQSSKQSYLHSMIQRGGTAERALRLRDKFVKETIESCPTFDDRDKALEAFGFALHPIMDAASPRHTKPNGDPRVWNPAWPFGHSPNEWIGSETMKELTPEILELQKGTINDLYDQAFP